MARSSLGFRYSFGFRHSSFGFENCGSWKAPFRFFARIGTMNPSGSSGRFGVPPSGGPDRLKPGLQTFGSWRAPFRFFRMHWDHEPKMRNLFICKGSILRFMESWHVFETHWDQEPTPSPSQEGSGTGWPVPLPGGGRGGLVSARFMEGPGP